VCVCLHSLQLEEQRRKAEQQAEDERVQRELEARQREEAAREEQTRLQALAAAATAQVMLHCKHSSIIGIVLLYSDYILLNESCLALPTHIRVDCRDAINSIFLVPLLTRASLYVVHPFRRQSESGG